MRRRFAVLTLALTLVPAATASAAEFKGTVDATTPKYAWESSGSGVPWLLTGDQEALMKCAGFPVGTDCDQVLLTVGAAAEMQITLESTEGVEGPAVPGPDPTASLQDLDGYLYKSNAAGEPQGDPVNDGDPEGEPDCVTSYPSEQCKVKVEPGPYVLVVEYYAADAAPMKGTVELLGVTPPPPPAGGGEQPPPSGDPQQPPPSQPPAQQPPPSQQPPQQPHNADSPPAPGTLPASGPLTVSVAADKGKRSTARKRGLRARVRCSVQCKATATAMISKKVARKLKLGKKAVRVARGKATITKAGRIPFYLKLTAKAKKALKRRGVKKFALTVRVTVTDRQGGQVKRVTKKITLR